jgi:hypothetical protein
MPRKKKGMEFTCIFCQASESCEEYVSPVEGWLDLNYARIGQYRLLCTRCGSFMYPSVWSHSPREIIFKMFSICKNASFCWGKGLYRPDCEKQTIKPDCLVPIFEGIADVSSRLDKLEKLYSSLNQQKPSPLVQPRKNEGQEK